MALARSLPRSGPAAPLAVLALALALSGCASSAGGGRVGANPGLGDERAAARLHTALEEGRAQAGLASWYGPKFHGRPTASGETFDMNRVSAAHKTLPFGTIVRVRNLANGRVLDVRINDRGPFVRGRILDLSRAAADQLGLIGVGVGEVELTLVAWPRETVSPPPTEPRAHGPWVQAGAFRDRARALALADRLRLEDPRFRVYSGDDGWHRVQARLDNSRAARSLLQRLRKQGIEAVSVVP